MSSSATIPFALRFAEPLVSQEELQKSLRTKIPGIYMGTTVQTYDTVTQPHGNVDPHADED